MRDAAGDGVAQAIRGEASLGTPESSINLIMLDVSHRYLKAAAAVQACGA
jgi:hypothetical protein